MPALKPMPTPVRGAARHGPAHGGADLRLGAEAAYPPRRYRPPAPSPADQAGIKNRLPGSRDLVWRGGHAAHGIRSYARERVEPSWRRAPARGGLHAPRIVPGELIRLDRFDHGFRGSNGYGTRHGFDWRRGLRFPLRSSAVLALRRVFPAQLQDASPPFTDARHSRAFSTRVVWR